MLNFFKSKDLMSALEQEKKFKLKDIKFIIKKVDISSYLDGSRTLLSSYQVYSTGGASDEDYNKLNKKIKEHYRDVFMACVVFPKLKRKQDDDKSRVFVDKIFNDWELTNELYSEIIKHTYGKKKMKLGAWLGKS